MERERSDSMDYFEREVLSALFERLDHAFPDFGWKRTGRGWTATNRAHTKTLPGEPRSARVVCNAPFGFLVHGGGAMAWAAYLNGGTTPRGAGFWDVARRLADLAGVDASPLELQRTPEQEARFEAQERRRGLLEDFHAFTKAALLAEAGEAARAYLVEKRGFAEKDLEELPFGLCPPPGKVQAYLEGKGYTADELETSGLLKDSRRTGRLVIPWRDRWGTLATLAARDLTGKADEGSKYLYLAGASKPEAFGLDVALRSQEGRQNLVLVEGLVDAVSLQAQGFLNVAALGGAGNLLTADRWDKLSGFGVQAFTLVLDNDEAGRTGTLAALDNASKASNPPVVYVVDPAELEGCKDPDELVREKGLEAFLSLLKSAQAAAGYRAQALLEGVSPESPDRERRAAVDRVLEYAGRLRGTGAGLDLEDVLRLTAERTGYTFEALADFGEDLATRRRREDAEKALDAALREAQAARSKGTAAGDVAAALTGGLAKLRAQTVEAPPPFSVDRLERESQRLPLGRPAGWDALDRQEVRFHAGELALLAARTGHGKTAALVGLLRNWLEASEGEDGLLVFYSAEEPEVRIYHRLLALESRLLALKAAQGATGWTANEVRDYLRDVDSRETWPAESLEAEKERLRSWESRLLVVHRPAWNVEDLVAHARALGRSLGGVFVDYLQRIPAPDGRRFDRRDLEVSAVARPLKSLAVDLSCPVVAGAQVNREAVPPGYRNSLKGKDYTEALTVIRSARPRLEHLREGGSEQEADLVLGLLNYRADFETDEDGERRGEASAPLVTRFEVGTLKNRYGTPGRWATLAFDGRFGLLRDPRQNEV